MTKQIIKHSFGFKYFNADKAKKELEWAPNQTLEESIKKAVDFYKGPSYEVIICGNKESDKSKKILQSINTIKQPNKVVIWVDDKNKSTLEKLMPFIKYFSVDSKDPVVYVCQDYSCQLPTSDISKVIDLLK